MSKLNAIYCVAPLLSMNGDGLAHCGQCNTAEQMPEQDTLAAFQEWVTKHSSCTGEVIHG